MINASNTDAITFDGVSFSYPQDLSGGEAAKVLDDVSFSIKAGAFALITGATGSGKTTLLRLIKPELAPHGSRKGTIKIMGKPTHTLSPLESASKVAYVFQDPENQIVCDSVWHELAFGLENLGVAHSEMHLRIAETCNYLGMEPLFHAHCDELSGGQKALLGLASALVMRPDVLLLDEPTAMLDPIAQKEFISLLYRANHELGITVVVATHNSDVFMSYATSFFRIECGRLTSLSCSDVNINLKSIFTRNSALDEIKQAPYSLVFDDVWQRYKRDSLWVLRGFDLRVSKGEVRALLGSNGSGKSTVLMLAAGVLRHQRGTISCNAKRTAYLPQNPKAVLAHDSLVAELSEWCDDKERIEEALERLGLAHESQRHPYDLSGGQQQLLALEKILLTKPDLVLLDEPAKGLDTHELSVLATRLNELSQQGTTLIVATHNMAFANSVAHSASLMFDGKQALCEPITDFFKRSWIYAPFGTAL